MPIYDYKCEACGHSLEALQKFSDEPLLKCPACHAPALKKQVTAAAFKLTGTGWYETDFKNKAGINKADTESASAKKDVSSSASDNASS